ncbi:MAG: hypothetical protein LIO79_05720 [Rikenellaceae bacterium]|nr:hypothetical protein [Rikenellaceae bacterium]
MKKLLLIAIIAVSLAACKVNDDADIKIENAKVSTHGISMSKARITVSADVYSTLNRKIKITEAQLSLNLPSGKELARAKLTDHIIVPKKQEVRVDIPLDIDYDLAGAFIMMNGNLENLTEQDIRVNGYIKGKTAGLGKKFNVDDMPLEEFIEMIGLDDIF